MRMTTCAGYILPLWKVFEETRAVTSRPDKRELVSRGFEAVPSDSFVILRKILGELVGKQMEMRV